MDRPAALANLAATLIGTTVGDAIKARGTSSAGNPTITLSSPSGGESVIYCDADGVPESVWFGNTEWTVDANGRPAQRHPAAKHLAVAEQSLRRVAERTGDASLSARISGLAEQVNALANEIA